MLDDRDRKLAIVKFCIMYISRSNLDLQAIFPKKQNSLNVINYFKTKRF